MKSLIEKLQILPDNPGIYLFYSTKKELIYVGKATSLKNRVGSYFKRSFDSARGASLRMTSGTRPVEQMIHEVVDIKTIQTDSVLEAIILEANTIKKYQPKYNVDLKDDKSWNYIVITKDIYPRVETVRQHEIESQKSIKSKVYKDWKYFFGPYPGLKTVEMIKLLRKLFFISTCYSPVRHVERSRAKRDEVETSYGNNKKQRDLSTTPPVGGFAQDDDVKPCFYYQLGQCLGVCTGEISPMEYKKKVIQPLIKFLRGNKKSLIKDLEKKMKEASKLEDFEEASRLRDQIKSLNRIQDVALLNSSFIKDKTIDYRLSAIDRVEGYDISNLGSTGMVGSMVVFENGEPNKKEYRKFKIKNVIGQSDVDCLVEVLERRLKHEEWKLPQVILVDGGKPQVSKAVEIIRVNKFKIPVVGIAKGPIRKKNEFIIGFNDREFIKWVNKNKELLIKVRDEAHRFAISYQKSLRKIK